MNRETLAALFLDAVHQVLDNKVFRILAGFVLFMVLATFLVGAREDGLVLLFGWKTLYYEDVFEFFGLPYPGLEGAGEILIQNVQRLLVDNIAGTLGILFAIAATAFFVPRMLEKGAADTLFSKPVSRFALLFSRYAAGLIFVALLAAILVGGMHMGFWISSGFQDPGFLWSFFTLVYTFALLHGVSVLIGVLTRSTVASILLSLVFMLFTGCVHNGWKAKDMYVGEYLDRLARFEAEGADEEADDSTRTRLKKDEENMRSPWLRTLFVALDTAHYALPKTTDAPAIARKLRMDLSHRYAELWDETSGLRIAGSIKGWQRQGTAADLEGTGVVWSLPDGSASMRLSRRTLRGTNTSRAQKAMRIGLENRADVSDVAESKGNVAGTSTRRLDWVETTAGGERMHRAHIFAGGGQLFTLEIEGSRAWREDSAADEPVQQFVRGFSFDGSENATDPFNRFEQKLGWHASLRYNIFFSIGSSCAFLVAILLFANWRLGRIDF